MQCNANKALLSEHKSSRTEYAMLARPPCCRWKEGAYLLKRKKKIPVAPVVDKKEHKIYVINTAALTKQQRSVLWHFRLGHPAPDVPVRLSRKNEDGLPFAYGIDNVHSLNCDCAI